ncbi:iron-dependent peroxidase [Aneurinibacillus uraniidurans]|uniref:iron-dependent peroxidase n=1 Tax=Aneurinibacillus uraniidurans TaxID=2966586 RepID=UPI00234B3C8D|nr:iron-dependent peroxidase [Aneurinibacillus sp. B1]WCN39723.1 iron-dependent peroxidase [Aneurinibacillus sp. B1]
MVVNYIWEAIIKAEQNGGSPKDICFVVADVYSPYMEVNNVMLNTRVVEEQIEINPYYRFYDIFRDLFDPNNNEHMELRQQIFDILIHFLADIDRMQGMNKQEYYSRFVIHDMETGMFGDSCREKSKLFSQAEKEVIAANLLRLYETGEALHLFKDTVRKLFKNSILYANQEGKDELLLYIGQTETSAARDKLTLLETIFLPLPFHTEVYWGNHFGIIDVEETMQIDSIALY